MNKALLNISILLIIAAMGLCFAYGFNKLSGIFSKSYIKDDVIEIDPDTIYLTHSGVRAHFSDVILSSPREQRKLIVFSQDGDITLDFTDRVFKQIDFSFLKKSQSISYHGTGSFAVDLSKLKASDIIEDDKEKTVTIMIDHPQLETLEIDPALINIGDVKEGLLARGDIKLTLSDYKTIETELQNRFKDKFNTMYNIQLADEAALKAVKEVFDRAVKTVDNRYSVVVKFKS